MKTLRIRKNKPKIFQLRSAGFTLIEMLVVISIILIIAVFSYTAVSGVLEGDRVQGGARMIDSFIEGARNRAIHSNQIRGVRFLLDPQIKEGTDSVAVSSMVYIGAPGNYTQGVIQIIADNRTFGAVPAEWTQLKDRDLLTNGARIKIPDETSGKWYTISLDISGGLPGIWKLNTALTTGAVLTDMSYLLELQPSILPNQEPRVFTQGVVIDLDESKIPGDWSSSGIAPYIEKMDILFAPDGNMIGKAVSSGLVHLVISDTRDVLKNRPAGNPTKEGDEFVVSIIPLTGNVGVYPIDPADIYRYAEEGQVAK